MERVGLDACELGILSFLAGSLVRSCLRQTRDLERDQFLASSPTHAITARRTALAGLIQTIASTQKVGLHLLTPKVTAYANNLCMQLCDLLANACTAQAVHQQGTGQQAGIVLIFAPLLCPHEPSMFEPRCVGFNSNRNCNISSRARNWKGSRQNAFTSACHARRFVPTLSQRVAHTLIK